MSRTIIHACSSVLLRPNGIVRYINAVIKLQQNMGFRVVFVTDSAPSEVILSDKIVYKDLTSQYTPNVKDGHVWLQIDDNISSTIQQLVQELPFSDKDNALYIAHDLHSFLALEYFECIFVQHESDVLTDGSRYSFLSDEYLKCQVDIVNNNRIVTTGLTVHSNNVNPHKPLYTPYPFTMCPMPDVKKSKSLLYVGDETDRKGASDFAYVAKQVWERYKLRSTSISHTNLSGIFDPTYVDVFNFALDAPELMYTEMARHRVAFIPSKNECPGIALLECLQYMPVIVLKKYKWTTYLKDLGPSVHYVDSLANVIDAVYASTYLFHDPAQLEIFSRNNIQYWKNISIQGS